MTDPAAPPLRGLKVIDCATIIAGPFAAASLGEFGAEVLKIEMPGEGDPLRRLGTPSPAGDTWWWLSDARNKRSLPLDLRTPEGAERFRNLAREADVIVENFRPGTLDRWGLGFESLRAENPGLIMLSVTGWGQTGPKKDLAGLARIAEGWAGLTHLTGHPDGPPLLGGSSALADY
ncbi:MAG TPA: CoA transferase, partial [Paracoccaceae bacterium]|nr:CoA transferase [Paracoccaceae bacterium]